MDPPQLPQSASVQNVIDEFNRRRLSSSQLSAGSQTAAEFIDSQLQLEADAREALPYSFDTCTQPLGPLRQILFACLTCNPATANSSETYNPAAVCYSCSIQCHGEHTLVELFNKRSFTCDCGTSRYPSSSPCSLRINPATNTKGGLHSENPAPNKYNHNFKNRFCGCECDYDAYKEKGTMFQCLGLGTAEEGGCGEDWWHPGCIVGLGPTYQQTKKQVPENDKSEPETKRILKSVREVAEFVANPGDGPEVSNNIPVEGEAIADEEEDDDPPLPPGFPQEDDFEGFICYKCVDANPWIKRYAGATGFLQPVFRRSAAPSPEVDLNSKATAAELDGASEALLFNGVPGSKKRKAEDGESDTMNKRVKEDTELKDLVESSSNLKEVSSCKYESLPTPPAESLSLFFKPDFRDHLCRCSNCFPQLSKHPQLLEEEDSYEPPVSEEGDDEGVSTVGSGSLLDRGERALSNVDRVRAIEGVMAYNHLKDKLTPFFKEFAESGKAISAEDIKAHFAKLRGDEEAIRKAGEGAASGADNRKEQSGY